MLQKSFYRILWLGLMTWLIGCGPVAAPSEPSGPIPVHTNGVIFPAALVELEWENWQPWLGFPTTDFWTPSLANIETLEADLPIFLQTAQDPWLRPDPPIWERVPAYNRQYLGYNDHLIYANFFCTAPNDNWQQEVTLVLVLDGGDCFFSVTYDLETRQFSNLRVNGEA
jgi:hypothetical protein